MVRPNICLTWQNIACSLQHAAIRCIIGLFRRKVGFKPYNSHWATACTLRQDKISVSLQQMNERKTVAVSSITIFFFAGFLQHAEKIHGTSEGGSRQSVLMSRIDRQWQTGRKTDRGSGMERTWNSVWRLISDGSRRRRRWRRWERVSVLERARLRRGGGGNQKNGGI